MDAVITMIESTRDICGHVYNIGPHQNEISIKELAYKVGHHCQKYPSLKYFPDRPDNVTFPLLSVLKVPETAEPAPSL